MNQYILLLRGVNVGGSSIMKMADLRSQLEELSLSDVATYIQTGNAVFKSPKADLANLVSKIEQALQKSLGYTGKVFVLTPSQIKQAAEANPFRPTDGEDHYSHIMFLDKTPQSANIDALMKLQGKEYRFHVQGPTLYYSYPKEFAGRNRRSINFEKVLGVTGTARTWKVVEKLIELTGA